MKVLSLCVVGLALSGSLGGEPVSAAGLTVADLRWLDRITYDASPSAVAEYQRLGRRRFLAAQLRGEGPDLPPEIAGQIEGLEIERRDGASLLLEAAAAQKQIGVLSSPAEKEAARKPLNERANQLLDPDPDLGDLADPERLRAVAAGPDDRALVR